MVAWRCLIDPKPMHPLIVAPGSKRRRSSPALWALGWPASCFASPAGCGLRCGVSARPDPPKTLALQHAQQQAPTQLQTHKPKASTNPNTRSSKTPLYTVLCCEHVVVGDYDNRMVVALERDRLERLWRLLSAELDRRRPYTGWRPVRGVSSIEHRASCIVYSV